MTGRADYFTLDNWNTVCYECGRKRKASTLVKHWKGYYVCKEHWEPRQVQDFVRSIPDVITPPWAQPMPANVFAPRCTPEGQTAIPELAVPGCVIPGFVSPFVDIYALVPDCLPYIVLEDEIIPSGTYIVACGSLVVEATLQLDGIIRIQ